LREKSVILCKSTCEIDRLDDVARWAVFAMLDIISTVFLFPGCQVIKHAASTQAVLFYKAQDEECPLLMDPFKEDRYGAQA
jgi:hypothetical protein